MRRYVACACRRYRLGHDALSVVMASQWLSSMATPGVSSNAGAAAEEGPSVPQNVMVDSSSIPVGMRWNEAERAMELAAAARREIYELWDAVSDQESQLLETSSSAGNEEQNNMHNQRTEQVRAIIEKYRLRPSTPREEDVSRGLGDAMDRLLLLCLPFPASGDTEHFERVLQVAGRCGRELTVRTVQHMFARTRSFAEALGVFYAFRRCHIAMSMETYHAMLYSLQRLEEEGWAQRFHGEYMETNQLSEQALDFVLRGVDNQLLPENKPWLGRIMFAETDNAASQRQSKESFDELGKLWVKRYKSGS